MLALATLLAGTPRLLTGLLALAALLAALLALRAALLTGLLSLAALLAALLALRAALLTGLLSLATVALLVGSIWPCFLLWSFWFAISSSPLTCRISGPVGKEPESPPDVPARAGPPAGTASAKRTFA